LLLEKNLGETVAVDLTQNFENYWNSLPKKHKREILFFQKNNYKSVYSTNESDIKEFHDLYSATMLRRGASRNYFFTGDYFQKLLSIKKANPVLRAVYHENKIVSAAIFTSVGSNIHYLYSGSYINILPHSALKLILHDEIVQNLGREKKFLHLGGGLGGQRDSLFDFKNGFGKVILNFSADRMILIREIYDWLSIDSPKTNSSLVTVLHPITKNLNDSAPSDSQSCHS
jgi:lipid II:glycine glycyltransferase (peptidoglycan interpeptide bridge formation enzyme)